MAAPRKSRLTVAEATAGSHCLRSYPASIANRTLWSKLTRSGRADNALPLHHYKRIGYQQVTRYCECRTRSRAVDEYPDPSGYTARSQEPESSIGDILLRQHTLMPVQPVFSDAREQRGRSAPNSRTRQ